MNLFISYSKKNRDLVLVVSTDLQEMGHSVWYDKDLTAGIFWWEEILKQIRNCDLFIYAVTPASLNSEPCKREYEYAEALNKNIIPILLVNSDTLTPMLPIFLQKRQYTSYHEQSKGQVLQLVRSINKLPIPKPLPDPLPVEPEIPLSPPAHVRELIEQDSLVEAEQAIILVRLKELLFQEQYIEEAWNLVLDLLKRKDLIPTISKQANDLLWERLENWIDASSLHTEEQASLVSKLEEFLEDDSRGYQARDYLSRLGNRSDLQPEYFNHVDFLLGKNLKKWILNAPQLSEDTQKSILSKLQENLDQRIDVYQNLNSAFALLRRKDVLVKEQLDRLFENYKALWLSAPALSTDEQAYLMSRFQKDWKLSPYAKELRETAQSLLKRTDLEKTARRDLEKLLLSEIQMWKEIPFVSPDEQKLVTNRLLAQLEDSKLTANALSILFGLLKRTDLEAVYRANIDTNLWARVNGWLEKSSISEEQQNYIWEKLQNLLKGDKPSRNYALLVKFLKQTNLPSELREAGETILENNVPSWLENSALTKPEQKWILSKLTVTSEDSEKNLINRDLLMKLYKHSRVTNDVKQEIENILGLKATSNLPTPETSDESNTRFKTRYLQIALVILLLAIVIFACIAFVASTANQVATNTPNSKSYPTSSYVASTESR